MISREPLFVSTAVGMNAQDMLPPFIPNIRSEDTVWAMMLRSSNPDSRIGHVPFSIEHEFSGRTPFETRDYRSVLPDVGMNVMLIVADQLRRRQFTDASEGLPEIGRLLLQLAAGSDSDFSAYLFSLWRKHVEITISQLQRLLQEYDSTPRFWAKDCYVYIRDLQRSLKLQNKKYIQFPYRRLLMNTGEMLIAWPAIWQAAYDLNLADKPA